MSQTLELLLLLSLVILVAKSAGLISTRLGQPAILGQLVAGLVLGPTFLDMLNWRVFSPSMEPFVLELGEIGVIFLMFIAGLEVDLDEMLHSGRVALFVGVLGVIVPLFLGTAVSVLFQFPLLNSIFIGLVLTATSVSISAQTLLELGVLRSREGMALLGAAVVDDVLGIFLLSLFLGLTQSTAGVEGIALLLGRMVLFFGGAIAFGMLALPRLTRWVNHLPISEGVIALVIVVTLLYAWSAQVVGEVAAITGAFVAGALFARTHLRSMIADKMHTLTYAFFVPIFLIAVGMRANARVLSANTFAFTAVIILVAIVGKIVGGWVGARLGGMDSPVALRVSIGMISRGEVGLIIAAVGLSAGLISPDVYAALILMVLVTTLITPILLRWVFASSVSESDAQEEEVVPDQATPRAAPAEQPVSTVDSTQS